MEYVIAATVSHARGWRAKLSSPPTHDPNGHAPNTVSSQFALPAHGEYHTQSQDGRHRGLPS
jgi:hypothetical protein